VDLHPDFPQVSFASACSGHGYKFASVIGEILADLAQRRNCRHDISLFALSRFGGEMSVLHRDKVELIRRGLPREDGHAPIRYSREHAAYKGMDTRDVRTWQANDIRPFW
jgi:hypothetical protein